MDWVALKMLPLSFFDDEETQRLFKIINPNVKVPKRNALRQHVCDRFEVLHSNLKEKLKRNTSQFATTIDGWTSIAGKSYYGITVHYIDEKWEFMSLTLDFLPSHGKHTGKDIAELFQNCLVEYGIEEKVIGVTVDNVTANTVFIQELSQLNAKFDGDSHFRCMAHILNLGCQDLMKSLGMGSSVDVSDSDIEDADDDDDDFEDDNKNAIYKVRSIFKKIRKSEQLTNQFKSACDAAGITYSSPILDCKTRWNSSHDMMAVALKLKKAIDITASSQESLKQYILSPQDWFLIEKTYTFLKPFKKLSVTLGGEEYTTLPSVVVSFNLLVDHVEKTVKDLDEKDPRTSLDVDLLLAFQACRDKVLKHYRLTNWVICMVLILDPRHKAETFDLTPWGREVKEESISKLQRTFNLYKKANSTSSPPSSANLSSDSTEEGVDFSQLYEKNVSSKNEIAQYIKEPRAQGKTNILQWWKANEKTYPTLAKMARDYLAIPATSVPAERLFSRASLVIRKHRNRLTNEAGRWLLCLNSWVKVKDL